MSVRISRNDHASGNALMRAGNQGSLTEDQVQQYDTDGFLVLDGLLDERDLEPARAALTEKVDQIAAGLIADGKIDDPLTEVPFLYRLARLFDGLGSEDFLAHGQSWRDRFAGYHTLMSNPKILDVIESLIGSEIFSNPVYNVRPKVPRIADTAVPWHQDKSYWPDANSNPVITVWVPIVDATEENGCLRIFPRTQYTRVLDYEALGTDTKFLGVKEGQFDYEANRPVSLPVTAGSVIVFNDRLVHSSGPNESDHVRWSVDLRYQPTNQDPMPNHGVGFLARSRQHPGRVATLDDWLAKRPEHVFSN